MGGAYGVLCPTVHIGSVSFPWIGRVTSSRPTSGQQESRDPEDATEHGFPNAAAQPPEAVATSRDQSCDEDYAETTDNSTRQVRSSEVSVHDDDVQVPVLSLCDDVGSDVVTSQPEPEAVLTSVVGRRRLFRDAALTITSQICEMDNSTLMLDGENPDQLESVSADGARPADVPHTVRTSRDTRSTTHGGSDGLEFKPCGDRSSVLKEILEARAKRQKVNRTCT